MAFCSQCGAESFGVFCEQCGAQIGADANLSNSVDFNNPYALGNQTLSSGDYEYDAVDPGFWGGYAACWRKYASVRGRASRGEYWGFILPNLVFLSAVAAFCLIVSGRRGYVLTREFASIAGALDAFYFLLTAIPTFCATVRRLHDQGYSGWVVLFVFVPYFGLLFLLNVMLFSPTKGPNQFGPQPKK